MYLLDTHTLLWWTSNDPRISEKVLSLIANPNNKIYLSAGSAWEIAIKTRLNKLELPLKPQQYISKIIEIYSFLALPITISHAVGVYDLPPVHNDPFDRILISQAKYEKLTIITNDPEIIKYEVDVYW